MIRVWEVPVEELLAGGTGTLALAPISNVPEGEVRGVIRRMKERLSGPKVPRRAADVWAATYVLLGLRYSDDFASRLFEEVLGMEQSATYQAIVRRGRAEEARRLLLLQGEAKFGPADDAVRGAIESMGELVELEQMGVRLVSAGSWRELVPPQAPRRRRANRRRSGG